MSDSDAELEEDREEDDIEAEEEAEGSVFVELLPVTDGINATAKAFDHNGKPMPVPHRISISPRFFKADDRVVVVYGRIMSANSGIPKEVSLPLIQLVGDTGKLSVTDRKMPVVPKFAKSSSNGG